MNRLVLIATLAACGSSPHQHPDGGTSDGATSSDGTTSDAGPDAATCASPTDTDGDGICDSLDVCPDVPDPGQADLDGDHIGWMCDPVESTTLPIIGVEGFVRVGIHDDTFAAISRILCTGDPPCGHELLQVSGAGMLRARSDSTVAADAWQASAAAPWFEGPLVTADDRVLWSRGYGVGDTGDYDLATHAFTSRANGVLDFTGSYELVTSGTLPEALGLSIAQDGLTYDLVDVRADGTLPTIATAQGFTNQVAGDSLAIPGTSRAIVTVRNNFEVGLQLYTRGASALTDILVGGTPMTGLGEVEQLPVDGTPAGFCAVRAGHVYAVTWDASGTVSSVELPTSDCLNVAATDRGAARVFYVGAGSRTLLGYTFAGSFHALAAATLPYFVNDTLPLYITTTSEVWMIDTTGIATKIASNVDAPLVSAAGTTVHILAHHGDPANGTWDLTRIRPHQATTSVTLLTNQPNGIGANLFTTVEGAALVSFGGNAPSVIVPSQSMTPVTSTVGDFAGGVRDGRTVVFSLGQTGALYAYSETNGTPQLTMLDSAGADMQYTLIDSGPTKHPTPWFAYGNQTTGCKLARFTTGTTLETIPCDAAGQVFELGTRADGALLVADGHVYALTSTGAQRIGVGYGAAYEIPLFDTSVSPPVLVAWQHGGTQNQIVACLAMRPERCWAYPSPNLSGLLFKTASATAHNGDGSFQLVQRTYSVAGQIDLTIVRSIGPGNVMP